MSIQFRGVTHYRGPENKLSAKLDSLVEANISTLTARLGNEGVALDGADSDHFLKNECNIELPAEIKNLPREQAIAVVNSNPDQYMPLIEKLQEVAADGLALIEKIFEYYRNAKNKGHDAEGNPVKEQLV